MFLSHFPKIHKITENLTSEQAEHAHNILLTDVLWRLFTRNLVKDQRNYSLFTGINTVIKWVCSCNDWYVGLFMTSQLCVFPIVLPSNKNVHNFFGIFVFTLNQCRKSCYFFFFFWRLWVIIKIITLVRSFFLVIFMIFGVFDEQISVINF